MTNRAIRVVLSALLTAFAITAAAQQLNPTVTLLKSPAAPVPNDCDQSLAPQPAPRVEVAQIPIPEPPARKVMAAPPTASVRAQLKDVQSAADRGDRDGFRDALARLKTTLTTYPAGGEKSASENVIRVYDDLDRIWTYQMETPTGAFFDAASVPGQIMRGYPGFDRAITDQVLVGADGTRFYPTTETREFLVREAAARLKTLGVAVATRAPRAPIVMPRVAPAKPRVEAKTAERTEKSEPRAASSEQGKTTRVHQRPEHKRRAETKVAEAHEKPSVKHVEKKTTESAAAGSIKTTEPAHVAAPKPRVKPAAKAESKKRVTPTTTSATATSAPVTASAAPAPATTAPATPAAPKPETTATTASAAAPAETTSSATETTASTAATSTTATTSAASTDTTATAAATDTTASTDTTGSAAKGQPQGKGVILPIILIVVGIGVLIVLFRASS